MERKINYSQKMIMFLLTAIVFLIAAILLPVQAEASMGFVVEQHFPSNQRSDSGYLDLRLTPGQEQELTLTVTNPTDKEIAVVVEAFTVSTARSGSIDYSNARTNDETLKHSISDLITISEPRVVIPAGMAKDVTMHLAAPNETFEGILLGSLRVSREPTEQELEESGAIVNRFAQAMAIVLSMDDAPVPADFVLGDITSEVTNSRASIVVDVRNPQPKLIKSVAAQARIVELESNKEIFSYAIDDVDFAPNSIFPLTFVDRAGYGVSAGSYKAYITLESAGQIWELEKEFEIAPAQATSVNSAALNQTQQSAPVSVGTVEIDFVTAAIISGGAVLLAAMLLAVMAAAKRKRQSNEMLIEMQKRLLEIHRR